VLNIFFPATLEAVECKLAKFGEKVDDDALENEKTDQEDDEQKVQETNTIRESSKEWVFLKSFEAGHRCKLNFDKLEILDVIGTQNITV
jgi:hypothetical protein